MITLCLAIFITCTSFASDTVRIYNPSTLSLTGFTNKTFTINSTGPSGEATSDTAPARVYVPIKRIVGPFDNINYSLLSLSGVNSLFDITNVTHYISYPLVLNVGSTAKYLYTAVRITTSGTSYYVVSKSSGTTPTYSNLTNSQVNSLLSPMDLCKAVNSNGGTVCNSSTGDLRPNSTNEIAPFKPMVYFFLSDESLSIDGGTPIDPTASAYSGGVFFETQMTNRVYDSTELETSISKVQLGDKRLIVTYSSSATMDASIFKKVVAFNRAADSTTNDTLDKLGLGKMFSNELSTPQSGSFTLNGLTNDVTYILSVALEDNFLFLTTMSPTVSGTPLEIQELLKKQACFILTAGFGEEHYITNYFRHYRDTVLFHSWLGKKLIKYYYHSAPKYALIIYQSESLRFVVRLMAYALYFVFNFSWLILIFPLLSFCLALRVKYFNQIAKNSL